MYCDIAEINDGLSQRPMPARLIAFMIAALLKLLDAPLVDDRLFRLGILFASKFDRPFSLLSILR